MIDDDYKCDLCNQSGGVSWTYLTPNKVPEPQWFANVNDGRDIKPVFFAEDEEWAVCTDCHILIEAGDKDALLARSVEIQKDQPVTKQMIAVGGEKVVPALIGEIARIHRMFWENKSPLPPVREPGYRM